MRIAVIGAGIGGLTAAIALLKRGFEVEVFEQARELGEIGAGVQISPNGVRVLASLGLMNDIEAVASEPAGKCVRLWSTGQEWKLFDLGSVSRQRYGFPYLTMHRGDLHQVLVKGLRALSPNAIRLDTRITDIRQDADVVRMFASGQEVASADFVVGADGVHSQVRQRLFGDDEARFSGIVAWRGVIDAETLPAHLRQPYGYNWLGPGKHVIHYPVRSGKLVNLVAVVEQSQRWELESWSQKGSREDFERDFAGWHEDVHHLIRAVETPYKWALMVRDPMSSWTKGRVTLLGDACHPTLPFLAQGAVMALEDGYLLARALHEHGGDIARGTAAYEAARVQRTAKIVQGANENATRFHNPQLAHAEGAAAYVDREWTEERVRQRYEWLFEYNVETLAL
ncbi:FAD-dependent monooxygenase [Hydrogenophaga palleronii]|uniref:FAD-dependent monooxygenase n=1 Tax=Hydrogenophaga palleronii TaxID=65655 RepID=UPI000826A7F3|nr:FAD-dependent monooxygenase [Hydrogenophaga palleronii]